jgi:hypothetical protein
MKDNVSAFKDFRINQRREDMNAKFPRAEGRAGMFLIML